MNAVLANTTVVVTPLAALLAVPISVDPATGASLDVVRRQETSPGLSDSSNIANVTTRLITLGELRCYHGDVETDLPKQKLRFALLVYLAMERSAPREKVAALLWPEIDEERARHRLNQSLYAIRQDFGAVIETKGDELRANDGLMVDARDFGGMAEVGEFGRALELYHRPFLEGFYVDGASEWERWADRKRAVLARTYGQVARMQLRSFQAEGQYGNGVSTATRWLELDEHAVEAHTGLLQALEQLGRRQEALDHYEGYERRLREQLGELPPEPIRLLVETIRATPSVDSYALPSVLPRAPDNEPVIPGRWQPSPARRLVVGTAILLAALTAVWVGWSDNSFLRGPVSSIELDTALYAVTPFAVEGPALELHEQQLLNEALGAWAGIRVVDQFQVDEAVARSGTTLDAKGARRIARQLGAGRYIRGTIRTDEPLLRVYAAILDARTGATISDHSVRLHRSAEPESAFQQLAEVLLFRTIRTSDLMPSTTNSVPARRAFSRGYQAIQDWRLAKADSSFHEATQHDPDFSHAYLWLAQVRSWMQADPAAWAYAARHALADSTGLTARDRTIARALEAIATDRLPQACADYKSLTVSNQRDFAAWYSYADCLRRDSIVIPNRASPTGFVFRSSIHEALGAFGRAFEILPSVHRSLSANSFQSVRRLFYTSRNIQRQGRSLLPDTMRFLAYASWAGDSLVTLPFPHRDLLRPKPWLKSESIDLAIQKQREAFYGLARQWASAIPASPDALESVAISLELLGRREALDTLRRARELSTSAPQSTRLAVSEVWLRTKFALPDDERGLRQAQSLADSLVRFARSRSTEEFASVASAAALIGQTGAILEMTNQVGFPEPEPLPAEHRQAALRLLVYAAMGAPPDTLRSLEQRVDASIRNNIPIAQQRTERRKALLRPALVALPFYRSPFLSEFSSGNSSAIDAGAALIERNQDSVITILQRRAATSSTIRAADRTVDVVLPEAWLWAAVGRDEIATQALDALFGALPSTAPTIFGDFVRAGALTRAMLFRIELARKAGDNSTADRWHRALTILWQEADPFLQNQLSSTRSRSGQPGSSSLTLHAR